MTPEQKSLIRSSYATLMHDPDALAATFYGRLFELDPTARPMFQVDIKTQGRKFLDMMTAALGYIDHLDHVVPALWQMGKRHGGYGVEHRHYETVREALLWTLDQRTEGGLPPEVKAAWILLYDLMAAAMQQAASEGIIARKEAR